MSTLFEIRAPGRRPLRIFAKNVFQALGQALPEFFEAPPEHLELRRIHGDRWEMLSERVVVFAIHGQAEIQTRMAS